MRMGLFRVLCIIFLLSIFLGITGCGKKVVYETDYYTYEIWNTNPTYNHIIITGLTELGKQQEILVIPREIEGLPVLKLGYKTAYRGLYGSIESDNLKRVYIENNILYTHDNIFRHCPNLEKVIVDSRIAPPINMLKWKNDSAIHIIGFVPRFKFTEYEINRLIVGIEDFPPNVAYMYNYTNAPNQGYYFIDDYDNELISFLPKEPTREGYLFSGWYKEKECINKWNFNSEIIPKKIFDENGKYHFIEHRLYAKWVLK